MSAVVIKSATAHLFHVGDSRIYRLSGNSLEQLTNDHRVVVSSEQSYLSRAIGADSQIEIDYQSLQIERGDVFLLATDGVHEYASTRFIAKASGRSRTIFDAAARAIVEEAYAKGQRRQPDYPDRQGR